MKIKSISFSGCYVTCVLRASTLWALREYFCCLQTNSEREWLIRRYEEQRHVDFDVKKKAVMAEQLVRCQTFDQFLAKKFGTVKRYGAEGAESMMAFFEEVLTKCSKGNSQFREALF